MVVRILNETSHDSWFRVPCKDTPNVVMKPISDVSEDQLKHILTFGLEEIGKQYDKTGALFSWVPWHSSEAVSRYESYFCSEFAVTALQRIGRLKDLDAKHTTPNALYNKISI